MLVTDVWKTRRRDALLFMLGKIVIAGFTHHAFTRAEFKPCRIGSMPIGRSDVYWCIGGFNGPHRLEKYAAPSQYIWADCDTVDPRKLRQPADHRMAVFAGSLSRSVGM